MPVEAFLSPEYRDRNGPTDWTKQKKAERSNDDLQANSMNVEQKVVPVYSNPYEIKLGLTTRKSDGVQVHSTGGRGTEFSRHENAFAPPDPTMSWCRGTYIKLAIIIVAPKKHKTRPFEYV